MTSPAIAREVAWGGFLNGKNVLGLVELDRPVHLAVFAVPECQVESSRDRQAP